MKSKHLAIFGAIAWILSVLASAEDLSGNYTAPTALVVISAIAMLAFAILAIIRLWRPHKITAILFLASSLISLIYISAPIKIINFILFIWVISLLWAIGKHEVLVKEPQKDGESHSGGKITMKKVLDFSDTYEKLKPFFALLTNYFRSVSDSEKEIHRKVKEIQSKTQQNLKEDELFKSLWVLRYVSSHIWLFELKPPKNQTELSDELLVINSALKYVLKGKNKLNYLPWLKNGLSEFTGGELNFNNLKGFKKNFADKLTEKIPHIAFECTEGRLGGELHDFVIELVMTTIQRDQKVFTMSDENTLTEEESNNIKNTIAEMSKARHEAAEDFMNSLG